MANNNAGQAAGAAFLSLLITGGIRSCQQANHNSSQSYQYYSTGSSNQYPNGSTIFPRPGTSPEQYPPENNPYETTFPDH